MKLHNNSRLRGVFVIPGPHCNLFKAKAFIEGARGLIGGPDLEKNRALGGFQISTQQRTSDSLAAVIGRNGQVQDLVFTGQQCTSYQETDDVDAG